MKRLSTLFSAIGTIILFAQSVSITMLVICVLIHFQYDVYWKAGVTSNNLC